MSSNGRSVRQTTLVGVALLAVLTAVLAATLITTTTVIHRANERMRATIESLRLVEEAEIDFLLLQRAVDPIVRSDLEGSLLRRLTQARSYVTSPDEAELLNRAQAAAHAYLAALEEPDSDEVRRSGDQLYAALETLISANVEDARTTHQQVAAWDRTANLVGVALGVGILVVLVALAWWFLFRVVRPIYVLADTMADFGRGRLEARAPAAGPRELRVMGTRFNEMAGALAEQRQRQLAFLAGVAHDLRNPLSALKMTAARFRPERALPAEPRVREAFDLVRRQADRLERMLTDFVESARIESGQLSLRRVRHDVRRSAEEVLELFEDTSQTHALHLRVPPEPVYAWCDPLRLEQVLTNLVSNAIKYSPMGGDVCVEVAAEGGDVVVSVADEGTGMTEDEVRSLFEPFRRTGLLQHEVPGTGLGLFVVRRIVEAHGGRIEVESQPGRGTRFTVRIPRQAAGAVSHA